MKKLALSFALISLLLTACGGKNDKKSSSQATPSSSSLNPPISSSIIPASSSSSLEGPSSSSIHVHKPSVPVEENKVPATCTEPGSSELVTYCSECHEELLREPHVIAPLEHDYEYHSAKAATCTEGGWEAYSVCKRCGLSNKVETEPLGHHFVKNNETLVYECDHTGCNVTNGRDYAANISYPLLEVHVSDEYGDFAPTCSFVNDDHALALGWYVLQLFEDDGTLYDTVTQDMYNGHYVFPEENLGKNVKIVSYFVVLDGTNVKYSNDGNKIENLQIYFNNTIVEQQDTMSATWYDGTLRKGFSVSCDLGKVQLSTNPNDYCHTYRNQIFAFDRVSSSQNLSQSTLDTIKEAYKESECRIFDDDVIEFLSNGDFDGEVANDDKVTKFGTLSFSEVYVNSNDDYMLSGSFFFTSEKRNGVASAITENVLVRRFIRDDDAFRLQLSRGDVRFFIWFKQVAGTPVHFEEHTHDYIRDEETLEYICQCKGCGLKNGNRDYEITISIDSVYVGDLYRTTDYAYSFKNDDNALYLGFVTYVTENGTFITPFDVDENYHFSESLLGQSVVANIYIAVNDDSKLIFDDEERITNCTVVANGTKLECLGSMTTDYCQSVNYKVYNYEVDLGTIKEYYGETPRLSSDGKTVTFGLYPQSVVTDSSTIAALNSMYQREPNGWYLYENQYYQRLSANPFNASYKFDNGTTIEKSRIYFFKCEPIVWNVLNHSNGDYLLMSNLVLDATAFNSSSSNRTIDGQTIYANNYEHSSLRTWLNNDFYNPAFYLGNERIQATVVDNSASTTNVENNPYFSNNTNDKVFLLSYQDFINENYDFVSSTGASETRYSKTTDYARARGGLCVTDSGASYCNGTYWTRSPRNDNATCSWQISGSDGGIYNTTVTYANRGVRPAITLRLG